MRLSPNEQGAPGFDNERAQWMLGKHVLIGLTHYDHTDTLIEQIQLHGDIVSVDQQQVTIKLSGSDEEFTLPPDLSNFTEAPAGEYRLRSTGEVVVDPDMLVQWTIHRPPPNE